MVRIPPGFLFGGCCPSLVSVDQVRPVPEAVELVKWHFGSLSDEAEDDYIKAKVTELSKASLEAEADSPAYKARIDDVAYDELQPALSVAVCPVCSASHWECKATYNKELHELAAFLKLGAGDSGSSSDERHGDLAWVTEPLLPTDDDCRIMTAVILTAHRFVKENERDRYGNCRCDMGSCARCNE